VVTGDRVASEVVVAPVEARSVAFGTGSGLGNNLDVELEQKLAHLLMEEYWALEDPGFCILLRGGHRMKDSTYREMRLVERKPVESGSHTGSPENMTLANRETMRVG
jgi:hypothetical protein